MIKCLVAFFVVVIAFSLPYQGPIIGIYTQDHDSHYTYIAASYVKFIQMAGAQVVPIFYKSTQAQLKTQLSQINGVLFPGGGMQLNIKNTFTKNADIILNYAKQQNDAGKVFPIWATCLGHELISYLTCGYDSKVLGAVHDQGAVVNTLKFLNKNGDVLTNWTTSNFQHATTGKGVLYFNHNWAVYQTYFNNNSLLHSFWNLLATTTSSHNQTFVSLMQAKKYPFFSSQFHPEKNSFEWHVDAIRSPIDAIQIPQRLAQVLVEKARSNPNKYNSQTELIRKLIYNYHSTPSSSGSLQQIYLFQEK